MAFSFSAPEQMASTDEALVFADGFAEFDALANDLDTEFGEQNWRIVANKDADRVIADLPEQPPFAIFAISSDLPQAIDGMAALIGMAKEAGMSILLIVGDISSRSVHRLMREGVAEFSPYPDQDGALSEAINRMRHSKLNLPAIASNETRRLGKVITAYGAAGGVGASTFIVNLAWEISLAAKKQNQTVALLDFNFQYGSIATYLDVPRREAVYELVSDASSLDHTGLVQALSTYKDSLHVLTAPRDALPLDIVAPGDVNAIVNLSREAFDYVLIDMPQALMNWSEQVYAASDIFYALMEIDMRSAQNMFRFLRTLKAEDMSLDKIRFVLNRAPGMTDLSGKARAKRVAESLGITFDSTLPEGGKQVINACDQGVPLATAAKSNPMRKEIAKVAKAILEADASATAVAS
ncbi:MAG: pilus assembly protein CpaE [Pseudomonadota bacterium]